jgi:hypothetical protein
LFLSIFGLFSFNQTQAMSRLILIPCLQVLLLVNTKAQIPEPCRSDSTYFYHYDDVFPFKKTLWAKSYTQFNSRKLPVETTKYLIDDNGSKSNERFLYAYTNGYLSYERDQIWNDTTHIWEDIIKTYYTNDDKGNPIDYYFKRYYLGKWENEYRYQITYDKGKESVITEFYWDEDIVAWSNSRKYTSAYNTGGKRIQFNIEAWDYHLGWQNESKEIYTYNADQQLAKRMQYLYKNGSWEARRQYFYTYDQLGQNIEVIYQSILNNNPFNEVKVIYEYDDAQGCLSNYHYYFFFDEAKNQWSDHYEEQYIFPVQNPAFDDFTIYPNPASSVLHIYTPVETPYTLIDMNGKLVLEGMAMKGENELNLQHLASGIYVLKAEGHIQKIILNQNSIL